MPDSQNPKPKVVLYGTAFCPYCLAARMLLKKKGVDFEDISVSGDDGLRNKMEQLSGGRTVPQIFIDDKPIGGFDDMNKLDREGQLDEMLGLTS